MGETIDQIIKQHAAQHGDKIALIDGQRNWCYVELDRNCDAFAAGLVRLGLAPNDRVAVYLPKQLETVASLFGAARAGGVFVPINPTLKSAQVRYTLENSGSRFLVTSFQRFKAIVNDITDLSGLDYIILVDYPLEDQLEAFLSESLHLVNWREMTQSKKADALSIQRKPDQLAALLYTSGSTGLPKGVMISHQNLLLGAESVSGYLNYQSNERVLAVLPLSFDYGLSQLTTCFYVGACAVLLNHLFPKDIITALETYQITGLAAVPPLWHQLLGLDWPEGIKGTLRFATNSGGHMPPSLIKMLKEKVPNIDFYAMYGLTEAFRSTYLPPEMMDQKMGSMGKAIPYADVRVVDHEGHPVADGEEGQLVHGGPLVTLGYWQDSAKTKERFKPLPGEGEALWVWSGDTVRCDADGYFTYVGRDDEMIKSSGYRISPQEIEASLSDHPMVSSVMAMGVADQALGQRVVLLLTANKGIEVDDQALLSYLKRQLPTYMVPSEIVWQDSMPLNANGKIDRSLIKKTYLATHDGEPTP